MTNPNSTTRRQPTTPYGRRILAMLDTTRAGEIVRVDFPSSGYALEIAGESPEGALYGWNLANGCFVGVPRHATVTHG